jgi:hypothetical protein
MARNNIFSILANSFDIQQEILVVDSLLKDSIVEVRIGKSYSKIKKDTIIGFINNSFADWKGRGTTVSVENFATRIGIDNILMLIKSGYTITSDQIITYLEYAQNMNLLFQDILFRNSISDCDISNFMLCFENVGTLIEKMNLKAINIEEKDAIELVQASPEAIAVSETVDEDFAITILRYHHHLLKGNTDKKREILLKMSHEFEIQRTKLEQNGYKKLASDVGFCLNKLDIRHNNTTGVIAGMTTEDIEKWYDYTYDLLLISLSLYHYLTTRSCIDALKVSSES